MTHELKTWPEYFKEVLSWKKNFEFRKNDRKFNVGDILQLREWDPEIEAYTGRECLRKISYVLDMSNFSIEGGFVIMSLQHLSYGNKDAEFDEAARHLIKYLAENHHPHTHCIVTSTDAEVSEGIKVLHTKDYLVD